MRSQMGRRHHRSAKEDMQRPDDKKAINRMDDTAFPANELKFPSMFAVVKARQ